MQPGDRKIPTDNRLREAARLFPPAEGVFLVGGCVRDLLISRPPADYDLAVAGNPAAYAGQLAQKHGGRPVAIGPERHRIFRVAAGDRLFDVSPLAGGTITADLKARDFTIDAIAFDLAGQVVVDPENGRADLENRVIRMVAPDAFRKDPLRQLRAFRLETQFQCRIETQTLLAIKSGTADIRPCAGERVRAELLKMLPFKGAVDALARMAECGLLFAIMPELAPLQVCRQNTHHQFDAWTHTLAAVGHLEALIDPGHAGAGRNLLGQAAATLPSRDRTGLLKLALLLHDLGKPATRSVDTAGRVHFYGHEHRSADISEAICRRLKFSRRETRYVYGIIRRHLRPLLLFNLYTENRLSGRAVTRFFVQCGTLMPDILLHAAADFAGKQAEPKAELEAFTSFAVDLIDRYQNIHAPRAAEPGLLTGRDLIAAFGLTPSPLFKKILSRVETARLAGEISDKQQALDRVRRMLDRSNTPLS